MIDRLKRLVQEYREFVHREFMCYVITVTLLLALVNILCVVGLTIILYFEGYTIASIVLLSSICILWIIVLVILYSRMKKH